jgi:uncharacterized membrane protein
MNKRLHEIDMLRGLVMIIMAVDHVRHLLHVTSLTESPTDLETTTPALFFTRWITHLCAPTFVFLSGVSIWLASRNTTREEQSVGLLKRGLWLIFLEFTLINFAIWFDVEFRLLLLQVIGAIGVGFLLMSLLIRISPNILGLISALVLATHDLVRLTPQSGNAWVDTLKTILFTAGPIQISPDFMFFVGYPLVPWAAVMILGYSLGRIFESTTSNQRKVIALTGAALLAGFAILRLTNLYGDPSPWKIDKNMVFTVMSFLNVTKYPPSFLFVLLFLGLSMLILQLLRFLPPVAGKVLSTCGRVPLFYYLIHFYLIRAAVFIVAFAQGFHLNDLLYGPFQHGRPANGFGLELAETLIVWVALVLLLYPLCVWFARYKEANRHLRWLKYL